MSYSSRNGREEKKDRRHPGIDVHPGDLIKAPDGSIYEVDCVLYAGDPMAAEVRYYVSGCKSRSFFWGEEISLHRRKGEKKKRERP